MGTTVSGSQSRSDLEKCAFESINRRVNGGNLDSSQKIAALQWNKYVNDFGKRHLNPQEVFGAAVNECIKDRENTRDAMSVEYKQREDKINKLQTQQNFDSVVGAGENVIGGEDKIKKIIQYGDSVYSMAKEELIRQIARDIFPLLHKKISNTTPIDQIVKQLKASVPDPRKGKRFTRKSNIQENICRKIGQSINKNYGAPIIDLNHDDLNEMCNNVSEIIYTLVVGMHTEFMATAGDVSKIAENMGLLETYLSAVHKKFIEHSRECSDPQTMLAIKNAEEFYERLMKELRRQTALLVNVTGDSLPRFEHDIVQLVKESGELKNTVSSINEKLGTKEFGQKLGYLLAGIDNTAQSALLVDEALKHVGLTLKDYADAKGVSDLREKMLKSVVGRHRKLTAMDLHNYMWAENIIFNKLGDMVREKVVKYLKGSGSKKRKMGYYTDHDIAGGGDNMYVDSADDYAPFSVLGKRKHTLKERLDRHKVYKKRLFNNFEEQIKKYFGKIVEAVHILAPHIGHTIVLSHEFRLFTRAYSLLEIADGNNIHLALSGYKEDSRSKDYRNKFLAALDVLHQTLEPLKSEAGKEYFIAIDRAAADLVELIENFHDAFLKAISDSVGENPQSPRARSLAQRRDHHVAFVGGVEKQIDTLKEEFDEALYNEELIKASGGSLDAEVAAMGRLRDGGSLDAEVAAMGRDGGSLDAEVAAMGRDGGSLDAEVAAMSKTNKLNMTDEIIKITGGRDHKYISLMGSINELLYFTKIASLRDAMDRASKDTDLLNDTYKDMLGRSVARLINNETENDDNYINILKKIINEKQQKFNSDLILNEKDPVLRLNAYFTRNKNDPIKKKLAMKAADAMRYVYERSLNAKKRFLETVQNMDLLLAAFTEGVQTTSEDVIMLKRVMDSLTNVKKFFTDKSGDLLVEVFESFDRKRSYVPGNFPLETMENIDDDDYENIQNATDAERVNITKIKHFRQILKSDHYYKLIETWDQEKDPIKENGPGDHRIGIFLDSKRKAEELFDRVQKALLGVRSLENLLATFSQLGSRFAGKNINDKVFMNHGQMFKSINEYIVCSAFGYSYGGSGADLELLSSKHSSFGNLNLEPLGQWEGKSNTRSNRDNDKNGHPLMTLHNWNERHDKDIIPFPRRIGITSATDRQWTATVYIASNFGVTLTSSDRRAWEIQEYSNNSEKNLNPSHAESLAEICKVTLLQAIQHEDSACLIEELIGIGYSDDNLSVSEVKKAINEFLNEGRGPGKEILIMVNKPANAAHMLNEASETNVLKYLLKQYGKSSDVSGGTKRFRRRGKLRRGERSRRAIGGGESYYGPNLRRSTNLDTMPIITSVDKDNLASRGIIGNINDLVDNISDDVEHAKNESKSLYSNKLDLFGRDLHPTKWKRYDQKIESITNMINPSLNNTINHSRRFTLNDERKTREFKDMMENDGKNYVERIYNEPWLDLTVRQKKILRNDEDNDIDIVGLGDPYTERLDLSGHVFTQLKDRNTAIWNSLPPQDKKRIAAYEKYGLIINIPNTHKFIGIDGSGNIIPIIDDDDLADGDDDLADGDDSSTEASYGTDVDDDTDGADDKDGADDDPDDAGVVAAPLIDVPAARGDAAAAPPPPPVLGPPGSAGPPPPPPVVEGGGRYFDMDVANEMDELGDYASGLFGDDSKINSIYMDDDSQDPLMKEKWDKYKSDYDPNMSMTPSFKRVMERFFWGKPLRKLESHMTGLVAEITNKANDNIRGPWIDRFKMTDQLFVLFIKSMVAKIFAVLGLYTIFNRPNLSEISRINLSMSSVRTILGGAQRPKIITEAIELYIRLPLLAEWYRDTIGLNRDKKNGSVREYIGNGMMIAFIPDITGDWAEFIDIIFNKTDFIREGTYSSSDIDRLVTQINKLYIIYRKKNPKDTVTAVCSSLVQEINKRYGLLKREEVRLYVESKYSADRYSSDPYDTDVDDNVDFDILNAKDSYGRRAAPSDKYLRYRPIDISKTQTWSKEVRAAVYEFRLALDNDFEQWIQEYNNLYPGNRNVNIGATVSFDETVRQYRAELQVQTDEHEKYNIVTRSIRGVGRFASIGADKIILFHELVVCPLVSLGNIYAVLVNFQTNIDRIHNACDNVNNVNGHELHVGRQLGGKQITEQLLHNFIENIYSVCCYTNLIHINISAGKTRTLILDFSDMRDFVETTLNNIKIAINKFRLHLDKDYIAKFESSHLPYLTNAPVYNKLSVYHLEDNLLEIMLKGRRVIAVARGTYDILGLQETQRKIVGIMQYIDTEEIDLPNSMPRDKRFGALFSRLVYWNPADNLIPARKNRDDARFPFTILPHGELADGSRTRSLDQLELDLSSGNNLTDKMIESQGLKSISKLTGLGGFYIRGLRPLYNTDFASGKLDNKKGFGLLLQFNQILAKYVQQFFDAPTRKIYSSILEDFINGPYSNAVMRGEALDDLSDQYVTITTEERKERGEMTLWHRNKIISSMKSGAGNWLKGKVDLKLGDDNYRKLIGPPSPSILGGIKWNNMNTPTYGIKYLNFSGVIPPPRLSADLLTADDINIIEYAIDTRDLTRVMTYCYSDPKPGVVILASIARAIKVLALRQTAEGKPFYYVDSLADLRGHIIENMKTNLLGFIKLFRIIQDRASFLKLLLFDTEIGNQVGQVEYEVSRPTAGYPGLFSGFTKQQNSYHARKQYLADMLDHIRAASSSIVNCILRTYRELGDTPLFMETYSGFFANYRAANGHYPLTLLSNLQAVMLNPVSENIVESAIYSGSFESFGRYSPGNSIFLPFHQGSTAIAKYNRGLRGVLHGTYITSDYFPGFIEIVASYNSMLQQHSKFDKTFIDSVIIREVTSARYISDIKHFKSQFIVLPPDKNLPYETKHPANGMGLSSTKIDALVYMGLNYFDIEYSVHLSEFDKNEQVKNDNIEQVRDFNEQGDYNDNRFNREKSDHNTMLIIESMANAYFKPFVNHVMGELWEKNLSRVIFVVENDSYKQSKAALSVYYTRGFRGMRAVQDATRDRRNARFLNLVDLDIVPINVHALAREVPLINIMNYSFSFDQMIKELFNVKNIQPGKTSLIAPTIMNMLGPIVLNSIPTSVVQLANWVRSENTLVTTLANPYMTMFGFHYIHKFLIGRIMSGGMGIEGFDRPKYLSDQIWNKVAIQEIHPIGHWRRPDASGPFVAWHRMLPLQAIGDDMVKIHNPLHPDSRANRIEAESRGNIFDSSPTRPYGPSLPNEGFRIPPPRADDSQPAIPWTNQGFDDHWQETIDDSSLSYYSSNKNLWAGRGATTELNRVRVKSKNELQLLGIQRYDTKLVRNIVWLTHLQRVVRWYLRQALHHRAHPLVYNNDVAQADNTEYYNNQVYDISNFQGPPVQ